MEEDNIENQLGRLKLSKKEKGKVAKVEDEELIEKDKNLVNSLACKIWTEKNVNVDGFKTTIPNIWNLVGQIRIDKAGKKICLSF